MATFAEAVPLVGASGSLAYDNTGATPEAGAPAPRYGSEANSKPLWFRYDAPAGAAADAAVRVIATPTSPVSEWDEPIVEWFTGADLATLERWPDYFAYDADWDGVGHTVSDRRVSPGVTYWIRVDFTDSAPGAWSTGILSWELGRIGQTVTDWQQPSDFYEFDQEMRVGQLTVDTTGGAGAAQSGVGHAWANRSYTWPDPARAGIGVAENEGVTTWHAEIAVNWLDLATQTTLAPSTSGVEIPPGTVATEYEAPMGTALEVRFWSHGWADKDLYSEYLADGGELRRIPASHGSGDPGTVEFTSDWVTPQDMAAGLLLHHIPHLSDAVFFQTDWFPVDGNELIMTALATAHYAQGFGWQTTSVDGVTKGTGQHAFTNDDPNRTTVTDDGRLRISIKYRPPRVRFTVEGWLSMGPAVPPPLRQRQRDDGLVSSAARQRSATSRQRSVRQRGYL